MDGSAHISPRKRLLGSVGLAALLAVVLAAYWPSLWNGFAWDDRPNLLENEHIRALSWANVTWAWSATHVGHYQPLTWLTFMVDHAIWGLNPFGYHLTNLSLHLANVILVFMVATRVLKLGLRAGPDFDGLATSGGVLAAALFGLHPMRVESVAWATERRDVLCGFFLLISVIAYLHSREADSTRHPMRWLIASVLAFVLSLLSKPLGMALPVVLLALDFYPLRRWRSESESFARAAWRLSLEKMPYFLAAIVSGLIALTAQSQGNALASWEMHGWGGRLAQAAYGIMFYLWAAAGTNWYPLYEITFPFNPFETRFVLSAVAVIALTVALFILRKRVPAALTAWICYILLLAPVLGFAQSGPQLVADRYSYLASISWGILLSGECAMLWRRIQPGDCRRVGLAIIDVAVLGGWSWLTWRQTHIWKDERTLWAHALKQGPLPHADNNYGKMAELAGEHDVAVTHYIRALAVSPTYNNPQQNLIRSLIAHSQNLDPSQVEAAAQSLRRSLSLAKSDDASGWYALGLAMIRMRNIPQAASDLERAIAIDPTREPYWTKLGLVKQMTGDRPNAIAAYERATSLDPAIGEAWLGLGIARIESRQFAAAVDPLERATKLTPNNGLAWTGLGACLLEAGNVDGAVSALRRALEIDPSNARAAGMLQRIQASRPTS